jgi:hypothetical protein
MLFHKHAHIYISLSLPQNNKRYLLVPGTNSISNPNRAFLVGSHKQLTVESIPPWKHNGERLELSNPIIRTESIEIKQQSNDLPITTKTSLNKSTTHMVKYIAEDFPNQEQQQHLAVSW